MLNKKNLICIGLILAINPICSLCYAQVDIDSDGLGQIIKINTRLHAFAGKPSWLLVIRDVDNGQTIPYLYDFKRTRNVWFAFTYGRNYLILASTLKFSPYSGFPCYSSRTINNFCNLESNGRIIRGESISVILSGELTPYRNTFSCRYLQYPDGHLFVVKDP